MPIADSATKSAHQLDAMAAETMPYYQLTDAELVAFRAAARPLRVLAGQPILRRGEIGQSMYVIESGQVELDFHGDMPRKQLEPGMFFGELALFVGDHCRMATATALEDCQLLVIDYEHFERLTQCDPTLGLQFTRRSLAYLVLSEQELVAGLKRRNEDLMHALDSLHQTRGQLSQAQGQIRTDELTGLCNRRGLYKYLEELPRAHEPGSHLGILLIDLDHFKSVNDRYGHLTGDEVLCAVARQIQLASGLLDLPCRLGGDEFALLMHVGSHEAVRNRAQRLMQAIRDLHFDASRQDLRVTASIGASLCREGAGWSNWYSEVDEALYRVKGQGGDGLYVMPYRPGAVV
nr:GGDEF domain-containing protein [Oleiagrimonas sp. C23AA]